MIQPTTATPGTVPAVPVPSELAAQLKRLRKRIDADTKERDRVIVQAHLAGASLREIEKLVGVSYGTVLNIIRRADVSG